MQQGNARHAKDELRKHNHDWVVCCLPARCCRHLRCGVSGDVQRGGKMSCKHDGNCGVQHDIYLMLGDWRFPKCKVFCDEVYGIYEKEG